MIAEHLRALDSPDHLHPGHPGLVDHTLEDDDTKNDSRPRFLR
jgi:hypothetical protein